MGVSTAVCLTYEIGCGHRSSPQVTHVSLACLSSSLPPCLLTGEQHHVSGDSQGSSGITTAPPPPAPPTSTGTPLSLPPHHSAQTSSRKRSASPLALRGMIDIIYADSSRQSESSLAEIVRRGIHRIIVFRLTLASL